MMKIHSDYAVIGLRFVVDPPYFPNELRTHPA